MDEQTQQQFIQWLAEALGVSSEEELNAAVEEMGEEGLQQAFAQFEQEMATQTLREGGKLNYLRKLQTFKKGGKNCRGMIKDGKVKPKTAKGATKWNWKKDGKSALGNRYDKAKKETTARAR